MEDVLFKSGKKKEKEEDSCTLVSSHSFSTDNFVSANASAWSSYCSGKIPTIQIKLTLLWDVEIPEEQEDTDIYTNSIPAVRHVKRKKERKKKPLLILIKWSMIWWDGQQAIIFSQHQESENLVYLKGFWQTVLII